jgi:hypothetical protein
MTGAAWLKLSPLDARVLPRDRRAVLGRRGVPAAVAAHPPRDLALGQAPRPRAVRQALGAGRPPGLGTCQANYAADVNQIMP